MKKQNVDGEQIRKLRVQHKWTQEDLAARCQLAKLDIDRGAVSKIESRLRQVTDVELYMLAHVLKVEIKDLYPSKRVVVGALKEASERQRGKPKQ